MALFQSRDTLRKARLGIPSKPPEKWAGYGIESGTRERVMIYGDNAEDVRAKARQRAYNVTLHSVWKVEK